jgi:hypothetical protein
MDLPHRRPNNRHALYKNILTAVRLDEVRPDVVAFTEDSLRDRNAALPMSADAGATRIVSWRAVVQPKSALSFRDATSAVLSDCPSSVPSPG